MDQVDEALLVEQIWILKELVRERGSRVAFLERILRQACMTYGGKIVVDRSLSEAAEQREDMLMFGSFMDDTDGFGVSLVTKGQAREWTRG